MANPSQSQKLKIDTTKTSVKFIAKHMAVLEVEGVFKSFNGTVYLKEGNFDSIIFNIEVKSIDTQNRMRDTSLISESFFDSEQYPQIHFEGSLEKRQLNGFLTIKNINIPVSIPLKILTNAPEETYIFFEYNILRSDYDLYFGSMDDLIEDEVKVLCDIYLNTK